MTYSRKTKFYSKLKELIYIFHNSRIIPYYQGAGSLVGALILAGLTQIEVFSLIRNLSLKADLKELFNSNLEHIRRLAEAVYEILMGRNTTYSVFQNADFRLKIEAIVMSWFTNFFCHWLGMSEVDCDSSQILSFVILLLNYGSKIMVTTSIVMLEKTLTLTTGSKV